MPCPYGLALQANMVTDRLSEGQERVRPYLVVMIRRQQGVDSWLRFQTDLLVRCQV